MGIISKNMGHASVAITEDIYAHITSNVMEEAALKIERQLFGEYNGLKRLHQVFPNPDILREVVADI